MICWPRLCLKLQISGWRLQRLWDHRGRVGGHFNCHHDDDLNDMWHPPEEKEDLPPHGRHRTPHGRLGQGPAVSRAEKCSTGEDCKYKLSKKPLCLAKLIICTKEARLFFTFSDFAQELPWWLPKGAAGWSRPPPRMADKSQKRPFKETMVHPPGQDVRLL